MTNTRIILEKIKSKKELFTLKYNQANDWDFITHARTLLIEMGEYRNIDPEIDRWIILHEKMIWDSILLRVANLYGDSLKKENIIL